MLQRLQNFVTRALAARSTIVVAAVLGALTGTTPMGLPKAASDCEDPYWPLELAHSSEPDSTIWPERAKLEAPYSHHPIWFQAVAVNKSKIYSVAGTNP